MKSAAIKKISILGPILVIASSVIAAFLPGNNNSKVEMAEDGTLVASSDGNQTCVINPGGLASCSLTKSCTTAPCAQNSYCEDDCHTYENTSLTNNRDTSACI
jgi:hypothetical protein